MERRSDGGPNRRPSVSVVLVVAVLFAGFCLATATAGATEEIDISLEPDETEIELGENATYEVVVTGAHSGIEAYDLIEIVIEDPDVAEFTDFHETAEDIGDGNLTYSLTEIRDEDGESADAGPVFWMEAALGDSTFEGADEIVIAEVEVTPVTGAGTTDIGLTETPEPAVQDFDEMQYGVGTLDGATFSVVPGEEFYLEFNDQAATADREVTVENVKSTDTTVAVLVTDESGDEPVVANITTGEYDIESVLLGLDEQFDLPGEYGAHLVAEEDLSDADYEPGDPLSSATAESIIETDTATIEEPEPAFFEVATVAATDPVEGENLVVEATIENTGDLSGEQTVTLDVGDLGADSTTVQLGGDEVTVENLAVETSSGDAGEYTATVSTANDTNSTAVTVIAAAQFNVDITATNAPVVEGDQLTVEASIENTGDVTDTQTVTLDAGDLGEDSTTVELASGEETVETFSVATETGDAGEYTVTVTTADDDDSETVTVLGQAFFAVEIADVADPVEGEEVVVETSIENTGDLSGGQTVTLDVGDLGGDSTTVHLDGGEETVESLTVETSSGDAGEYTATVTTANDTDSATVFVQSPANFTVGITEVNEPFAGEALAVTADIENTGDATDEQTVVLDAGQLGTDSASVELAGGEGTVETLAVDTQLGDAGEYTVTVTTANDTDSASATVVEPDGPFFAVGIADMTDPIVAGETLTVAVHIENTGDLSAEQTVAVDAETLGQDNQTVGLEGGESTVETLAVATESGDEGTYTVTVASENDTVSAPVTVQEPDPAEFAVFIVDTNSPVDVGEPLTVDVSIGNVGDMPGTQTVTLDAGPLGTNSTTVSLAGGALTSETFSVTTDGADAGEYIATVTSENDTATEVVTVQHTPHFAVSIAGTGGPVVGGETLEVAVAIENTGEAAGSQTVTVALGDVGSNSTSVQLDSGEETVETVGVETDEGDAGTYLLTVASDDENDSASVTVLTPAQFAVDIVDTNSPVGAGETVSVTAAVVNTGDVGAEQTLTLDADPLGTDNVTVTLDSGETVSETFTVDSEGQEPGEYTATVTSEDSEDSVSVTLADPPHEVTGLDIAGDGTDGTILVEADEPIQAAVTNAGDVVGEFEILLTISDSDGSLAVNGTTAVQVPAGATEQVTFDGVTDDLDTGIYDVTVTGGENTVTGLLAVSVDVDGNGNPARDTTGDGLMNDIDGDAAFDIFDVQTLYNELDSDIVQAHPDLFTFNTPEENPDDVTIFDVQALFNLLASQ